jgi:protein-L-isoaspartate(D-aspartate) O-methyltransferase
MNIEHARTNMIEQQIRTWEVLDPVTLETIAAVKRENFVPSEYRNLAFSDLEIPLSIDGVATGEAMFTPKMEARLLQELAPQARDTAMEIGTGSGYMAALLGARCATVDTCEIHFGLAEFARRNLQAAASFNVTVVQADGFHAAAASNREYDVICLSGAVELLPKTLMQRLRIGGRMVAVVGRAPVMSAVLVTRVEDDQFDQVKLFETFVKRLVGGPQLPRFRF